MKRFLLRFLNDRNGYVIEWDSSDRPHGWLEARIGTSEVKVLVNADQAYYIEPHPPK